MWLVQSLFPACVCTVVKAKKRSLTQAHIQSEIVRIGIPTRRFLMCASADIYKVPVKTKSESVRNTRGCFTRARNKVLVCRATNLPTSQQQHRRQADSKPRTFLTEAVEPII